MSAATIEQDAPEATTEGAPEVESDLAQAPAEETETEVQGTPIFKFSGHIDLPAECETEDQKRGSCKDPEHFHAWVRLPNKFQHREIRDKALAAKARKQRQLRDLESDSHAVLEVEMEMLLSADKGDLIEEVVSRDAWKDQIEAMKDVQEMEAEHQPEDADSDEPVLKYDHIEQDQERLKELDDMPEDDRPGDEYEDLVKHVATYLEDIEKRLKEIQEPQRNKLQEREIESLVEVIRDDRIEGESTEEYLHTYNTWQIVKGTLDPTKSGLKFGDREHLERQSPEVVDALVETFTQIEGEARAGKD